MDKNIFDEYQAKGCIPSIGGQDEIYDKLMGAANSIAEDLKGTPEKITRYCLVALDNDIPESESVLEEIEKEISKHWKMVRSQFIEMPITLYRAIVLRSLQLLVENNSKENFSAIIYWSVVDIYPYFNISQREQNILQDFIHHLGDVAEDKAIMEWTIDKENIVTKIPTLKLKITTSPQLPKAKINENLLKERLLKASGPWAQGERQNRAGANRYWPNNGQHWSWEFAPLAAKGITEVVNKALASQHWDATPLTEEISNEINKNLTKLKKSLVASLQDTVQSSVAVERRSQLLWWKETLYSRKLRKSYRKLSQLECAVAMAFDLFGMLPDTFPVSVEYILREAFWKVQGDKKKVSFQEFFNEVYNTQNSPFLESFFLPSEEGNLDRGDLLSFLKELVHFKVDIEKETMNKTGVELHKEISYEDISVWILHCLAVRRLTQN